MTGAVFRIVLRGIRLLAAFAAASLAAGLIQAAFVVRFSFSDNIPAAATWIEQAGPLGVFILLVVTQTALFAAPFALIAVIAARWLDMGGSVYYVPVGAAIGLGGFTVQWVGETPGNPTIVNLYALTAYLVAGAGGGLIFGLFAGGRRKDGAG